MSAASGVGMELRPESDKNGTWRASITLLRSVLLPQVPREQLSLA